ncbi:MAG: DUF2058 domain-containing protein [Candidatus Obscuribacterales bacterium]|nr:DUF2058 domain-containing protein [Steroidobacteraceae bacterium]
MSTSLRDQLLAAGLVSKKQAQQAELQEKQQQHSKNKVGITKRAAPAQLKPPVVPAAQLAKAARDQELNRKKQAKAERKARLAEIRQLIEQHRLPKIESDEYYNFTVEKKIRRIAVNAERRERLMRGEVIIVRCDGLYDVVPPAIADRIRERDPHAVIPYVAVETTVDADDPYMNHAVPDDLTW